MWDIHKYCSNTKRCFVLESHQPKSVVRGQVGGEAAHQRTRVLVGDLLAAQGVAEHESRHGLGLEDG